MAEEHKVWSIVSDLAMRIRNDTRRSIENSMLAAVGVTALALVAFIGQIADKADLVHVSLDSLWYMLVLFFILVFSKIVNSLLEALYDSLSKEYAIYVFFVWAFSILASITGFAYVAFHWYAVLAEVMQS